MANKSYNETVVRVEILLVVILAVALAIISFQVIISILDAAIELLVACITGIVTLAGIFISHVLKDIQQQKISQMQAKQKNYENLINHIDSLVNERDATNVNFAKVHLHSWIVGSPNVIQKTEKLIKEVKDNNGASRNSVEELLNCMREDLGLTKYTGEMVVFRKNEKGTTD
ncbi:MAG: hypothetical protein K9L62_16275 [Vallitaleaceae bacterium]|nr:hypothetical protein [Vallitaleaceae bacterium]